MQHLKVREGKNIYSQGENVCNILSLLHKMPLRIAEENELTPLQGLQGRDFFVVSVLAENILDANLVSNL